MSKPKKTVIRARDVMRTGLVTIEGLATIKQAADKMRAEHVSCLLVEKRTSDDAWGIVAIRDMIQGVIIPRRSSTDVHVYEVMTKPLITVPADMDIRYVAHLLHTRHLSRVPVEQHDELVGMISLSSLILNETIF